MTEHLVLLPCQENGGIQVALMWLSGADLGFSEGGGGGRELFSSTDNQVK